MIEKERAQLPPHLKGRVDFQSHDFFVPQPVSADVYVLRHICHDWTDTDAAKLLGNFVPAMKPSSRVLLVELVARPPGTLHYIEDRMQR